MRTQSVGLASRDGSSVTGQFEIGVLLSSTTHRGAPPPNKYFPVLLSGLPLRVAIIIITAAAAVSIIMSIIASPIPWYTCRMTSRNANCLSKDMLVGPSDLGYYGLMMIVIRQLSLIHADAR